MSNLAALQLDNYAQLRAYSGADSSMYISGQPAVAASADIAGHFVRDDADVTTADNGGTVIVDAAGRRWKRQFSGRANARWFGATGDGVTDDAAAIQAAVDTDLPVHLPAGKYFISTHITVAGASFELSGDADKTTIYGTGYVEAPTAADTSYPTATNPGPMSGCGFYFTSNILHSSVKDIWFGEFKFALAFFAEHNAPVFTNCMFSRCNAFVFCYQGSQNFIYEDIFSVRPAGPMHISSATCFPAGSPYAGRDNYYTDGLIIRNTYRALGGGQQNDDFDTWFQASILRIAVPSTSLGTASYVYPFAASHVACRPSGWLLAYVPARNPAGSDFVISNMDARGGGTYGMGLFNGTLTGSNIRDYRWERIDGSPFGDQHFMVGSVVKLSIEDVITTRSNVPQVPFLRYSGHLFSDGYAVVDGSKTNFYSCDVTPHVFDGVSLPMIGISKAVSSGRTFVAGSAEDVFGAYDPTPDGFVVGIVSPREYGSVLSDDRMTSAWNAGYALPIKTDDGNYRRVVRLDTAGYDVAGLLQVSVVNLRTGETDAGKFWLQTGTAYTLTTSAPVANGDTSIQVTSDPPRSFQRFSKMTIGGVTVTARSYDEVTKRIMLDGRVSGLAAVVAAGATITKPAGSLATLQPMARGFASIGYGLGPTTSAADLCVVSNVAAYRVGAMAASDQSIYVTCTLTSVDIAETGSYGTAAPTTGLWVRGAKRWNTAPSNSAGQPVGWICVAGGTPGTWRAFGATT